MASEVNGTVTVHGYHPHEGQREPQASVIITGWFKDEDLRLGAEDTRLDWEQRSAKVFGSEAQQIFDALSNNLPGGTMHQLLILMLQHKLCLYKVLDQPDTTIRDIAYAARDFVWAEWKRHTELRELRNDLTQSGVHALSPPSQLLRLVAAVEKRFGPPPAGPEGTQ